MTTTLETGQVAPTFSLPGNDGKTISLSDYAGKPLVLYFYPKDNTPGCTTEAQDFTATLGDFQAQGAEVVGVSRDSVKKHENFIAKYDLGIDLISDEEGSLCEAYGVWVEKKNYGRTYMGIERSTFLIDANGKINRVWRKVRVKGHVAEVLDAVRAL